MYTISLYIYMYCIHTLCVGIFLLLLLGVDLLRSFFIFAQDIWLVNWYVRRRTTSEDVRLIVTVLSVATYFFMLDLSCLSVFVGRRRFQLFNSFDMGYSLSWAAVKKTRLRLLAFILDRCGLHTVMCVLDCAACCYECLVTSSYCHQNSRAEVYVACHIDRLQPCRTDRTAE